MATKQPPVRPIPALTPEIRRAQHSASARVRDFLDTKANETVAIAWKRDGKGAMNRIALSRADVLLALGLEEGE